ncbi:protein of unknown function [Petrocella atlantisensis]|uniref:Uncharacterized protein n=1 Tax=Petrocella atlantisensis TaxID=2173034 RepID=A0A3P7PCP4_9FIRM|nr:hypothetical protein [Petrocella atlantisensis]VDN46658.1 protein of unknown function [Petrocella atlantisensis]
MGKIKKILDLSKKATPAIKKVMPAISTAINSIDVLENTSKIAKPFVDDARIKGIEKSKIIEAHQTFDGDNTIIAIERAGIIAISESEDSAFELFVSKLERLREKRVLSSDKKVRKEQKKIIDKVSMIIGDQGDIRNYIYRTEFTKEQIEMKKNKKKWLYKKKK